MITSDNDPISTKEDALQDLERQYKTPGAALYMSGITNIKKYYKKLLSEDEIRDFLARSRTYTTHYSFKPPKYNPYFCRKLRYQFQLDLTEISKMSQYNDGFRYILLCIDIFSRKLWTRLLKSKTANEVLTNFKSILKESGKPDTINSDQGAEWTNKAMLRFCKEQGIEIRHPFTQGHSPFVERVGLTIQNLIYKFITANMNYRFVDNLDDLVQTYNSRRHRSTGLTPNEGEMPINHLKIRMKNEEYYSKIKKTKKIRFKINDLVRISRLEPKFGRGYDKSAPEEIFRIIKIITKFPRVMYEIASLDGDETIIGRFYQEQITRVKSQNEFVIEEVLKEKRGKVLVKWLGYKNPSWIRKKNMTTIKDIQ